MNIGHNIRQARVVARLSQEELAGAAGINRTYLSQLENGHSSPTLDVLGKIARALGMSPTELLADKPSAREPEPQYEVDADTLTYPGLVELLSDQRTRLLMKPSADEIEVLRGIRFLNRFSPSKELFVEILLDYRRRKSEEEAEPAGGESS
ncbi:MAG TPA: helix-turn-helix domain-containing protein [bacterium]|jgi:transcriptional regulator with XRE-family HTH domain